ncbi:N(4)-acetylcytidine aminohydrolase [Franconibacter daqui]|uniref:N(4)-acetylcytidine amidohydrolase n=1 Tax=Franconibacter daqui TaxID=2047724 RepID=A0ABV1PKB9_9ENTR
MLQNDITFFARFEPDILAGRKTITIRDAAESHFQPGQRLRTGRYEDNGYFCTLEVISTTPVALNELNDEHARQENMTLAELRQVIAEIYPGLDEFYVIAFKRIS